MTLEPLEPFRRQVAAGPFPPLGWPVLLARETIEGDLSFADPDSDELTNLVVRPGSTLHLSVRVTARERIRAPRRANRKLLPDERFAVLDPGARGMITVGRGPENDLVLRDPSVSTQHARIHPVPGTDWCFVVDLGSRNGTAHNDIRVLRNERAELQSGDEVAFGRQVFVFLNGRDFERYVSGTL